MYTQCHPDGVNNDHDWQSYCQEIIFPSKTHSIITLPQWEATNHNLHYEYVKVFYLYYTTEGEKTEFTLHYIYLADTFIQSYILKVHLHPQKCKIKQLDQLNQIYWST